MFDWVNSGRLALPELQRPAVWQDSKVPDLLDSLYRGYPMGLMLLWTPPASDQLRSRAWSFGEQQTIAKGGVYFLIDGQQRMTALYRALHGPEQHEGEVTLPVAFDLINQEFSLVDGPMRSKLKNSAVHGCYPVRTLLKLVEEKSSDLAEVIACHPSVRDWLAPNGPFSRLLPTNILVATYSVGERSYADAVEIFDRVNRGTPVKQSQVVLARLSSVCPGIVGTVEQYLGDRVEEQGRDFDLDFVIRGLAVVARGYFNIGPLKDGFENAAEVYADFKSTCDAIDKAFAFVARHLGMDSFKRLPGYDTILLLAFAIDNGLISAGSEAADRQATDWAVKSLLTGYHDSDARVKADLELLREAADTGRFPFAGLKSNQRGFAIKTKLKEVYDRVNDIEQRISRSDYLLDFLYAILRTSDAPSLNGQPMWPPHRPQLQIHHLYAFANLERELHFTADESGWLDERRFDDIGNLTFILTQDNFELGNEAISYLDRVPAAIRAAHFIADTTYRPGAFKTFVKDRRHLLRAALEKYVTDRTVGD